MAYVWRETKEAENNKIDSYSLLVNLKLAQHNLGRLHLKVLDSP